MKIKYDASTNASYGDIQSIRLNKEKGIFLTGYAEGEEKRLTTSFEYIEEITIGSDKKIDTAGQTLEQLGELEWIGCVLHFDKQDRFLSITPLVYTLPSKFIKASEGNKIDILISHSQLSDEQKGKLFHEDTTITTKITKTAYNIIFKN